MRMSEAREDYVYTPLSRTRDVIRILRLLPSKNPQTELDYELPMLLWVDAVCINQHDKLEKSFQTQFMAVVYAMASRVLA